MGSILSLLHVNLHTNNFGNRRSGTGVNAELLVSSNELFIIARALLSLIPFHGTNIMLVLIYKITK